MKQKFKKTMYFYSLDSRLSTKGLGKKIRTSQQNASYLISNIKDKKIIKDYSTIIDPAKLGSTTIVVYYRRIDLNPETMKSIISYLKNQDAITEIEFFEEGFDFACVFCVTNLSLFNKINRRFIHTFRAKVAISKIYPIVVRHLYPKKYLLPQRPSSEIVICGDRETFNLNKDEMKVLEFLFKNTTGTLVEAAEKLSMHPRSIAKIKQKLEENKIIRAYIPNWNLKLTELNRKRILLKSEGFSEEEEKKLLTFAFFHPCIVGLTKYIGDYDVAIDVEGENLVNKDVLTDLRSELPLSDFLIIRGIENLKNNYINENILKLE
ncbi:MAG: Lrp/AsnC family transcriptional regulator [Candidatus Woesearchaeota archaeon]